MNGLLAQLLALTGALECCAGVPQAALDEVRRLLAACLVQQNPGLAPVLADPAFSPALNAAAQAGAALAAERTAAGVRLRFLRPGYGAPAADVCLPLIVLGPFVDAGSAAAAGQNGGLVEWQFFESTPMRSLLQDIPFINAQALLMRLPQGTAADPARRVFSIPAGTVWVQAHLLVFGTAGFVALRVSAGTLVFEQAARVVQPSGNLEIFDGQRWTLTLTPEAAPEATAEGSDGNALALTLPSELVVRAVGGARVAGAIGMAGFGQTLAFDTPVGAPVAADQAIVFAYDAGAARWSINRHRSVLLGLSGDCTVQAALWALPVTQVPPAQAGQAANGGVIGLRFLGALRSSLDGWDGHLGWRDVRLLADAQGLDLRSRHAVASARLTCQLWAQAEVDVDLDDAGAGAAPGHVTDLRLASRRNAADSLSLAGGRLRTRWDLPRDASGAPFGVDAPIQQLALLVEADGQRRVSVVASQPAPLAGPERIHGLVLENAYLSVTPARQLALAASGATLGALTSGLVRLRFDMLMLEPMLPDPYAANWQAPNQFQFNEGALSATLRWLAGAAPALALQLDKPVDLPQAQQAPAEFDARLTERFRLQLQSLPDVLSLLDLSSHDHHLGLALEPTFQQRPLIDGANRLAVQLHQVRLMMQPQVHWEPVQDMNSADPGGVKLASSSPGGRTLVGANTAKQVALLPSVVGREIVAVANGQQAAAALFALPFGLSAFVHMDRLRLSPGAVPPITVLAHEPAFAPNLAAALQVRLLANGRALPGRPPRPSDPARGMPGAMKQTSNLLPNASGLDSVLATEVRNMLKFEDQVPLHAADLSGYGLSCFSRWQREPISGNAEDDAFGVTQVQFDVLQGRTAYEVIQVRSVLAPCQARVVRTTVMERHNGGRVQRFDSGWQAVDDGLFSRYVPFETGLLRALRRVRRIRTLKQPLLRLPANESVWQPVLFDADAQIDDLLTGGTDGLVPALDQAGYIQIEPVWDKLNPTRERPTPARFAALFKAAGGLIGGAIDCRIRLAGTLEMHLHALMAACAPNDVGQLGFVLAAYGTPTLPRAGGWSVVRIDGRSSDVSPVDPQYGVPVVRLSGQPYTLRQPAQARQQKGADEYGWLLSTDSSRVLFARPTVSTEVAQRGRLSGAPPLMADPTALVHASGLFPRSAFVLQGQDAPLFDISAANDWKLKNPNFRFLPPLPDVASGAAWGLQRTFDKLAGALPPFTLNIDSALPDLAWKMAQPAEKMVLSVPVLGELLSIDSSFAALSGAAAGLFKPAITFGPALDELKKIVNSLGAFIMLPAGMVVNVDVDVVPGPSPSFSVHLNLKFSIGGGPDGRIEIGVGKFFGEFELDARLEAALNGKTQGRLLLVFQGDVQQAILPPVLYAGGMFRFAIEVKDGGPPVIEMGLGTATSIGGDLIPGLVALEATVKYGYMLIPQTLQPGVMLSIDARAQLAGGLLSLCFSADALARIERFNREDKTVTIFAQLRVAGRVQVAVFLEESFEFQTQFEQRVPLGPLLIAANVNPLAAAVIPLVL